MGYLFLFLALAGGMGKGFFGRSISHDVKTFRGSIFVNMMRMFFCAAAGLILALVSAPAELTMLSPQSVVICLLSAVSMSVFCVAWMYAYKTEAYMFLSIFTMLGSVVTCFLGFFVYHEPVRLNQWIGMMFLFAAVFIMSLYNKSIKGKLTPLSLIILISGCLGSAAADFCQKLFVNEVGGSAVVFNFYTYTLGFVMLAVIFLFLPRAADSGEPPLADRRHVLICAAMALCLYLNSTTKTAAASFLSSAQIYPVLQGANLIGSSLMAHFLFREKIRKTTVCGMAVAFAGLLVMHML